MEKRSGPSQDDAHPRVNKHHSVKPVNMFESTSVDKQNFLSQEYIC